MQRGVTHQHAGHLYGLQTSDRRNRPRTSHLELHVADEGHLLLSRELKRHRPARRARHKAQLLLQRQRVHLDDHAINIKAERRTVRFHLVVERQHRFRRVAELNAVAHRQAPRLKLQQTPEMGIRQLAALQNTDAVAEERKRSLRGDARIKLAQRARRRVTRVSKHLTAGATCLFVNFLEARLGQKHLAAHFQTCRNVVTLQLQRDRADGTHVGSDVFARRTVATRCGTHQHAVFIEKTDRQAIQLQFAAPGESVAAFQAILHALVKREKALFIEDVIQRQHRYFMTHLAESAQRLSADALGGRIRCDKLRVLRF